MTVLPRSPPAASMRALAPGMRLGARLSGGAKRVATLACIALCVGVCGCASVVASLDPPKVTVGTVRMVAITPSGVQIEVSLDVANPNARVIQINSLDFTIEVNDVRIADGRSGEPVEIPARGSGQARIIAMSNFASWSGVARRLSGKSSVEYFISGIAQVNGTTLPFSRRGRIDAGSLLGRQS